MYPRTDASQWVTLYRKLFRECVRWHLCHCCFLSTNWDIYITWRCKTFGSVRAEHQSVKREGESKLLLCLKKENRFQIVMEIHVAMRCSEYTRKVSEKRCKHDHLSADCSDKRLLSIYCDTCHDCHTTTKHLQGIVEEKAGPQRPQAVPPLRRAGVANPYTLEVVWSKISR